MEFVVGGFSQGFEGEVPFEVGDSHLDDAFLGEGLEIGTLFHGLVGSGGCVGQREGVGKLFVGEGDFSVSNFGELVVAQTLALFADVGLLGGAHDGELAGGGFQGAAKLDLGSRGILLGGRAERGAEQESQHKLHHLGQFPRLGALAK